MYEVYDDGALVTVTVADLDGAATRLDALGAALANAAGAAGRADLVPNLHRSLVDGDRSRKLAAAKALLALGDQGSIGLLDTLADTERDDVTAKSYTAVALRLRGPDTALEAFRDPATDPKTARLLVSNAR